MANWNPRANEIFLLALEAESQERRRATVDAACGGDAALRRQVVALLAAHEQAGSFLNHPLLEENGIGDDRSVPRETSAFRVASDGPGTCVGPFKLLQEIGEGGMGSVYMAEQQQPVQRKVAVKVIKAGLDSRQVVARFEAERQALALMDHPNIAKVLDGGATPEGRPYFVMELVRGVPIARFCDEQRLTVRQRLELFVPVCEAVQHAHQKGIIHRDLKPSNVLIAPYDGRPVPKVIDFGVAKATGAKLTDRTLFTEFGQVIGTLEYMSPEQAELNNQDIDTRSDIYSLGVLLYELLTGTTPLERRRLSESALLEALRLIREEEPPKPSTRLSATAGLPTIAEARGLEPAKLNGLVRGELDWIVMKALEKDRNRRYETANSLARDVERYLRDETVLACPPSAAYRFRKFARRNRAALAMASVVFAALVLVAFGLAVSTLLTARALDREKRTAYAQRVALAEREWSANNLSRAVELLEQCPEELRGWEWHYLQRLLRGKSLEPLQHGAPVLGADLSPDGGRIASSGHDGVIKLWDAWTGKELKAWRAHPSHARCVAFSPDGLRLASSCWVRAAEDAGQLGEIKMWDPLTRRAFFELRLPGVDRVAFSPDGERLGAAGYTGLEGGAGMVRICDAATGSQLLSVQGHKGDVFDLAFSPDGGRLATVSMADQEVKVWDLPAGREALSLRGHRKEGWCVAFSPDGRLIAAGSGEFGQPGHAELKVWDARTGRERFSLGGHVDGISSVAFSPDGTRLVTGGLDHQIKVWDASSGQEVLTLRGHADLVRRLVFSRDGHRLVSASDDRTVRVWDARPLRDGDQGQESRTMDHRGGVNGVAFHPDGRRVASAGADGTVKVWDARSGRELSSVRLHAGQIQGVAFSRDGKLLAAVGDALLAKVWDVDRAEAGADRLAVSGASEVTGPLRGVAFSPDGRWLATAGYDWVARLWDVKTRAQKQVFRGHGWVVNGVAFHRDGRLLATAGTDGTVRLWDVQTGQEMTAQRLGHSGLASSVAFRPDGRLLASGGWDRAVRLWERGEGGGAWKALPPLVDPTGCVESVCFSPDGKRLAWGGSDATVKVWESATGKTHTLRGHLNWVHSVAFSPDGKSIASGSQDGTVKIWETP